MLVEFASATEAVRCAVEVQQGIIDVGGSGARRAGESHEQGRSCDRVPEHGSAFTRRGAPPDPSGGLQILVHQRQRADAFASCCEDRVEHRRGRDGDRRLAGTVASLASAVLG